MAQCVSSLSWRRLLPPTHFEASDARRRTCPVKTVKNTSCSSFFSHLFTISSEYFLGTAGDAKRAESKSSSEQNTKSGGSDPTFSAFSRPKSFVGSLPPDTLARDRVLPRPADEQIGCQTRCLTICEQKGEKSLSILKAPPKQPKNSMVQVRVEEYIKLSLDRYAEFIGANASYVVSEALKLLFKKDEEFKRWLDQQPSNNDHQPTQGGVFTKTT